MIAAAVVAVALAGGIWRRRSVAYRERAAVYAALQERAIKSARELAASADHDQQEAKEASGTGERFRDFPQIQRN